MARLAAGSGDSWEMIHERLSPSTGGRQQDDRWSTWCGNEEEREELGQDDVAPLPAPLPKRLLGTTSITLAPRWQPLPSVAGTTYSTIAPRRQPLPTHIVLLVDVSGSMRIPDVEGGMSRLEAAERCVVHFVEQRARQHPLDRFSLAAFSDRSDILARALDSKSLTQTCSLPVRGSGGTYYRAALASAVELMSSKICEASMPCHVILLSDGRPADSGAAFDFLQDKFLGNGKHAGTCIHGIALGASTQDFTPLQQIACLSGGMFTISSCRIRSLGTAFTTICHTISDSSGTNVTGASFEKVASMQLQEAPDSPTVHKPSRQLRAIAFEPTELSGSFGRRGVARVQAVRTTVAFDGSTFTKHIAESGTVTLRQRPFMRGAMRLVFGFEDQQVTQCGKMVAKLARFVDESLNSIDAVGSCVKSTALAQHFATLFREQVAGRARISFVPSYTYEVTCDNAPCLDSGYKIPRYFCAEPFMPGAFLKYNSNAGYVGEDAMPHFELVQSFTHFTFAASGGKLMIADLQGVAKEDSVLLTDPQVLSLDGSFGPGDLRLQGIGMCLKAHRCGPTCRKLGLEPVTASSLRRICGMDWQEIPGCIGSSAERANALGSSWDCLSSRGLSLGGPRSTAEDGESQVSASSWAHIRIDDTGNVFILQCVEDDDA
eukprot:CAMPEP_0172688320 /NCGR_PEP_ID=MMETSP1074-20121228/22337_1 /TAXON_ID=2916 /ORGANISM="Ceratium fusus, Strain PA161109" /LENGTH=659 /DNA_ID=CAMNT_0013507945 /DNA_START=22 /DNA_END=1998 /DNA_ORIENTATION=-